MRREGLGIIEVLIVLGLGVALTTLGVRFLSGAGHQAVVSATGAENLGLANQLADVFRKRLGEYEVVDVSPGATSIQFTAIAAPPSWAGGGEVVSLSGSELTVRFSPSSFSALAGDLRPGQFAYLSLPQQKLIFATTVSRIDRGNRQVTFALPPSCFPRGIQIAGSQIFVKPAIALEVRALPSPPFLSIQGGLRFDQSAPNVPDLQGRVSFSYVFLTQGGGQFTLTDLPSYPTTQVTQDGQTGFLYGIAIYSRISRAGVQGGESSALLSIPVRPAVTSCATPHVASTSSDFTVVVSGPSEDDSFFSSVYSNAPDSQKVLVRIGGDLNVIPSLGTYSYRVPSGAGVDLRATPLTASESLSVGWGRRTVFYTFAPDPPSATFPPDTFSPLFPNTASVTYRLVPGRVRMELPFSFTPPLGASWWRVDVSPVGGRYAQSGSFFWGGFERALQLPPGAYDLSFSDPILENQIHMWYTDVKYTEVYRTRSSPLRVVLSSGETVNVSNWLSYPEWGTLVISWEVYDSLPNLPDLLEVMINTTQATALPERIYIRPKQGNQSASLSLPPGAYKIQVFEYGSIDGDRTSSTWLAVEAVVGVSSLQTTRVRIGASRTFPTLRINVSGIPEGQALIVIGDLVGAFYETLRRSGTIHVSGNSVYRILPQDVIYGGRYYEGRANPASVKIMYPHLYPYSYTVDVTYVPVTALRIVFRNSTPCSNGAVRLVHNSFERDISSDETIKNVPGEYRLFSVTPPSGPCVHEISPSSLYLNPGDMGTFTVTVRHREASR